MRPAKDPVGGGIHDLLDPNHPDAMADLVAKKQNEPNRKPSLASDVGAPYLGIKAWGGGFVFLGLGVDLLVSPHMRANPDVLTLYDATYGIIVLFIAGVLLLLALGSLLRG